VIEAGAVLRVLLDAADHLALAAVLRSALVGVPDAALEPLWQLGLPQAFAIAESRPEAARVVVDQVSREWPQTDGGWRSAVVDFAEQVGRLRRELQELSSDEWIRRLREELGIEALELVRPLGAWRCEGVRRIFELVRQALDRGQSPIEVASSLRTAPSGQDDEGDVSVEPNLVPGAVRVMTVHAAKGLDFDQVFVAQLHKEPALRRRPRATAVLTDASGGRHLVLAGWPAPDAWRGEEASRRVAAAEQVRLFYVALTRARERLVLVGRAAKRTRPHPLSFADLIAGDPVEQGSGDPTVRVVELVAQAEVPTSREGQPPASLVTPRARLREARRRTSLPFVATPSSDGDERVTGRHGDDPERAKAVGRIVHRALELVDLELEDRALARQLPDLVASLARHEEEDVERGALGVIGAFVEGPLWPRWVGSRHRIRARELPFVSPGRDGLAAGAVIGVLDCVVEPDDSDQPWLVVDYKTDRLDATEAPERHAERYRLQGEAYATALARGLGLRVPPRVEWWFLREGLAVELPSAP
jgi:ATP-dependent exoDNAse (exonuclease V) beta subunit